MKRSASMIIPVLAICAAFPPYACAVTHNLGASFGFPQSISLTYRADMAEYFSLEGYVGSLAFLANTAGGRLILGSTSTGIKPRCFMGVCIWDQNYGDKAEDPMGTEAYFWTGAGLEVAFDSGFKLFADLGYIGDGNRDKGLGYSTGLSISGGLLFPL